MLFLQIFLVLTVLTAGIAGTVALESYGAALLRTRRERAARRRHYVLYVLFRLRQLAALTPSLQKKELATLYDEGVLDVHPEGFATYQALLRWFYRQLDRRGRQITLWQPVALKTSRIRLVQPQTA